MSYHIAYEAAQAPPHGPTILAFMEHFYHLSDTESLHEEYAQSFAEDATLVMGSKEANGFEGESNPNLTAFPSSRVVLKVMHVDIPPWWSERSWIYGDIHRKVRREHAWYPGSVPAYSIRNGYRALKNAFIFRPFIKVLLVSPIQPCK